MLATNMSVWTKWNPFLSRLLLQCVREPHICLYARTFSGTEPVLQDVPERQDTNTEVAAVSPPFSRPNLPIVTSRRLQYLHPMMKPKQAWLETLESTEDEKLGVIDLHPEIFAANPRIDMLHKNIMWQSAYRRISYASTKSRAEVRGGGRKPWPQKKTGRARHGSIRSPLWVGGGVARGPRGPKSYFYMLPKHTRVYGLRVALSVKYAQNDLHIVESLEIPTDDEKFIEDLVEKRHWGYSVLFVDDTDFMPRNVSVALSKTPQFNLMPVYGLNVYSMLKHETLVLTLAAVEKIEQKLLFQMHKTEVDRKYTATRTPNKNFIKNYERHSKNH